MTRWVGTTAQSRDHSQTPFPKAAAELGSVSQTPLQRDISGGGLTVENTDGNGLAPTSSDMIGQRGGGFLRRFDEAPGARGREGLPGQRGNHFFKAFDLILNLVSRAMSQGVCYVFVELGVLSLQGSDRDNDR